MKTHQLDELDNKILTLISKNARMPYLEIARACEVSGAAIHQRIQRLTQVGILKGSEFIIDPMSIGYQTCAFIGLYLQKASQFQEVVDALNKVPEIVECHFTTGKYAMFLKIYAKNNQHLLNIIHEQLQDINGIASTETIISFDQAYRKQLPIGL